MSHNRQLTPEGTTGAVEAPSAHPLAIELARAVTLAFVDVRDLTVLVVGVGAGRNIPPLLLAGLRVDAIDDDATRAAAVAVRFADEPRVRVACAPYAAPLPLEGSYAGAVGTHAFLHGTPDRVAAALRATRARLLPGAPLLLTLGSVRDPRFGAGTRIDAATFAPASGSERGVAHAFFDAGGVRALLRDFTIDALEEGDAAGSLGRWAHADAEAEGIVHWFVRARRQ